jgi:hypothetical protein
MNNDVMKTIIFLLLFSQTALSQIKMEIGTRHVGTKTTDNAQVGLFISLKKDLTHGYQLLSFLGTGNSFAPNWHTFHDYRNNVTEFPAKNLRVRQLSLRKNIKNKSYIEVGSMAPWQGIMEYTAMNKKGWVDGARMHINTKYGEVTISGGSIQNTDNPNVFNRKRELNYIDIHLFIRFLVEEMNNIDSKAFRYNVNTEFQAPIRRLFNKEMKNTSISLGANYGYISPQFTQERRELVGYNFLYQEGHQANIYSKLKTGHFTWFGNARFSKTPLFVLGVKKSFKWTKKGPH